MKRKNKWMLPVVVAGVLVAVFVIWKFWPTPRRPEAAEPPTPVAATGKAPATASAPSSVEDVGISDPEAQESFQNGMTLQKDGKYVQARTELSKAYFSGKLQDRQEAEARSMLSDLAEKTIFSGKALDGDPYVFRYTFEPGEVINKVERKLELHVPPQFILRINGIADGSKIRAGQTVTMVQGPFHALVTKSAFTMDLYLLRQDRPKTFVKRLRVGLGKDDGTPVGDFHVALGKKLSHAPWNPPANSPLRQTLLWDEPGYPLGKEGYWISLEGLDDKTSKEEGYGIHGTNEPGSIGRSESMGCIRLADPDIDLVFSLLYEKWSTVQIVP